MPQTSELLIDKIALTIDFPNESVERIFEDWFNYTETASEYPIVNTRGSGLYSRAKEIVFDTDCKLLVEYHSRGLRYAARTTATGANIERDIDVTAAQDRRPIRLEFNPSKLNEVPPYKSAFIRLLNEWFGDHRASTFSEANITRIDFAVDVWGQRIDSLCVARADTTVASCSYSKDGRIQTQYLGSPNSALRFAVYDKQAQSGCGTVRTRIEARLKQRLTFDALRFIRNPFELILIREAQQLLIESDRNSQHIKRWFLSSCLTQGLQATLAQIRNPKTRSSWRNQLVLLDDPEWWSPGDLWADGLPSAIAKLELWPSPNRRRRFRELQIHGL